ncbi:MAG TPA: polymer-forming cytoskeletal protein [Candidatus Elarobacter sp.]|jgi:hypothetical protein
MKYVSREQFMREVPRKRAAEAIDGDVAGDVTIDRDTDVKAVVAGSVRVRSGSQAFIVGRVQGNVTVDRGASAYLTGMVGGDLRVDGDVLLIGIVHGSVTGGDESFFATGGPEWMK